MFLYYCSTNSQTLGTVHSIVQVVQIVPAKVPEAALGTAPHWRLHVPQSRRVPRGTAAPAPGAGRSESRRPIPGRRRLPLPSHGGEPGCVVRRTRRGRRGPRPGPVAPGSSLAGGGPSRPSPGGPRARGAGARPPRAWTLSGRRLQVPGPLRRSTVSLGGGGVHGTVHGGHWHHRDRDRRATEAPA